MKIIPSRYKHQYLLNKYTRGLFFLAGDIVALLFSAGTVYLILSPFVNGVRLFPAVHTFIIAGSILFGLLIFKMYLVNWKYTSLKDLVRIIMGIMLGGILSLIITPFILVSGTYGYVFTVLVTIMAILTIGGFRIAKRLYSGLFLKAGRGEKHTIIFGAASKGEQILRDILLNNTGDLAVYALFDDREIPGLRLHGVKVLGGKQRMMTYLEDNPVDQLIVAIPQYPKKELKVIIEEAKEIRPEIDIKILPSFHSLTDDPVGVKYIRDVQIEDILGRKPVEIDFDSIKKSITGKVVLVTGAGGSIGGELVQQCAKLQPGQLIALDIDETELYHVENKFKDRAAEVIPCVASVTDEVKMDNILNHYKPEVIFHAAAYKHVPMMEIFPEEAVKVNIGGTQLLASLASKHKVDKFVMVSTDKAVNPANVMGATKRVAEEICMAQNELGSTKFISVRFGNVLGSRGSVVPLFIKQIKNGGPLTVTDADMQRYFMTIPEAVLLVIQAGAMGAGGEVFVLDMGAPVKILDMAEDLIRLHNLEPGIDIDIKFTGLRPGEKLFEELLNAGEGEIETEHSEISKAICSRKITAGDLDQKIETMFDVLKTGSAEEIRYQLKSMVPTYSFTGNGSINGQTHTAALAE
jgi:FlaA1/EpsC-like NDP-sugar epimerase